MRGCDGSQPPPVAAVSKVRMSKLDHKVQRILTTLQVEDESEETIDAEDLIKGKVAYKN